MTAGIYRAAPPTGGHDPHAEGAPMRAWCEVDLDAVRANAAILRARAGVPLVPMVKGDGYGLGAVQVARALGAPFRNTVSQPIPTVTVDVTATAEPPPPAPQPLQPSLPRPTDSARPSHTPWGLGIATLAEGAALRNAGCSARLLCTTPFLPDELPFARRLGITPMLHRSEDIRAWRAITTAPWHLDIDTGMQRAGVRWDDIASVADAVAEFPPEGVATHFFAAERHDGSLEVQERRFRDALARLTLPPQVLRHSDNSPAHVARTPSPFELARPGIALYGSPANSVLALHPVVHVRARIVDLRLVRAGETVSYDATWTATRDTRLATVAIGHGDAYRRQLSNRGEMLLHGQRVPVVGVVTMDMTMLDITDLERSIGRHCAVGDIATAIGTDPAGGETLTVDDVAALGGLSPYELLAGLRMRLPRVYLGGHSASTMDPTP